ncbi:MAG TPA: hypothetical protein P5081_24585 [Phycisphaerae bacterium]|nr:hypothetical protein [Phycisphaerae bacterium]HRW56065.1 hypothetical protein [Phycisphaerae bacterium]
MIATVAATSCNVPFIFTLGLNPCGDSETPAAPEPVFVADPADATMGVLISGAESLPTYEAVLAQYVCHAETENLCDYYAQNFETGECNDGAYLYIFVTDGGVLRLYFDAVTHQLVGAHEDDSGIVYVLPPGPRLRPEYYIERIVCEDPIVTRTLCPMDGE